MRATILYGPRDIRIEDRPAPTIVHPTDAVIRLAATCVCGSDLWPYRGVGEVRGPHPIGHEYRTACRSMASASSPRSPTFTVAWRRCGGSCQR